jgi:hypothetical protein
MAKIKIQIEADSDEFSIEDLEERLYVLQDQFEDEAKASNSSPWIISIINKNGTTTPLVQDDDDGDGDEDGDEDDDNRKDESDDNY